MEAKHYQLEAMGTRMDLVFAGSGVGESAGLHAAIGAEVERIEAKLSLFRHDSWISTINSTASHTPVVLDEEMDAIFTELGRLYRATEGYFDPTAQADPAGEGFMGWEKVGHEDAKVRMPSGMRVDLGGYGKGYALRSVRDLLQKSRVRHALISFGESSIYAHGTHPAGPSWQISIPNEQVQGEDHIFELRDEALSTSGNSLNNFKGTHEAGHIVNPRSGKLSTQMGLVSVKSNDPVLCEVFSTALFAAGQGDAGDRIAAEAGLEFCWTGLSK